LIAISVKIAILFVQLARQGCKFDINNN